MQKSSEAGESSYDAIVKQYQAGKIGRDEFFSELFDRYYSTLVRAGRRFGLDVDESRDLAQETFVRVYRHLDQLNPSSSLRAYLLTAYRNAALNYIRATHTKKRDAQLVPEAALLNVEAEGSSVEESVISRERVEQLRHAIVAALTPDEAALLMSHFVENLSSAEMAEILAISPAVLRVRIQRALVKLQKYLAKQNEGLEETRASRE